MPEKGTTQPGVLTGKPREHVRAIHLQRPGESMRDPDALPHHATPVCHPWGHGAPRGTLGHERLARITVPQEECARAGGSARIGLRAARRLGWAIARQQHRLDGKEHEPVILP